MRYMTSKQKTGWNPSSAKNAATTTAKQKPVSERTNSVPRESANESSVHGSKKACCHLTKIYMPR